MTIKYNYIDDFYYGVQKLVKQGLTFEADHSKLTIELLGGF
jgi:hypothetical protein